MFQISDDFDLKFFLNVSNEVSWGRDPCLTMELFCVLCAPSRQNEGDFTPDF